MKPYSIYQHLPNTPMTERDVKEQGSKFWNEGKFNNFVKPFLKERGTLIDMGCNAGLFLKLAEDMGFKALGVDFDKDAVDRGEVWRDANGGKYEMYRLALNESIDKLPLSDYTVLANAHYYFTINDFLDYLDKLKHKTRYCIVVTDEKRHLNRCWASADVDDIRSFYKEWEEVGFIDLIDPTGDPSPRKLRSLCFKSKFLEKIEVDKLDASNHVQDGFYTELLNGKDYKDTRYFRIIKNYRKGKWSDERLHNWFQERVDVFNSIKKEGCRTPLIVDKDDRILDGNHRSAMLRELGHKEVFIRRV